MREMYTRYFVNQSSTNYSKIVILYFFVFNKKVNLTLQIIIVIKFMNRYEKMSLN